MSSFAWYTVGAALLLAGIAYALILLGVPTPWIVVTVLIAAGIRIMMGVAKTRPRD